MEDFNSPEQSKYKFKVFWSSFKQSVRQLNGKVYILYTALKDSRTPWYAKVLIIFVVGYALSPVDLIPDFIPVLGYLDDFIIVPLGVSIALRLIPDYVIEDCKAYVRNNPINSKPKNWIAGSIIIGMWTIIAGDMIPL